MTRVWKSPSVTWKHGDVLILRGMPEVKVMFMSYGRVPGTFVGLELTDKPPVFQKGAIDGFDSTYYDREDTLL